MQGARASLQPHMSTSNKSIRHKGFVAFEMPSSTAVSGQKSRDRHMPSMRRGQWCCAEKEQSSDTKLADVAISFPLHTTISLRSTKEL